MQRDLAIEHVQFIGGDAFVQVCASGQEAVDQLLVWTESHRATVEITREIDSGREVCRAKSLRLPREVATAAIRGRAGQARLERILEALGITDQNGA